jgi:MFS transporter, DHA2 family, methylenomycin A resistance protein
LEVRDSCKASETRAGRPLPSLLIGLAAGAVGLLGLVPAVPGSCDPALVPGLMARGFGMSFTMPAAMTAVVDGVAEERAGLASGAVNAARQVGSVVGIALLGALVAGGRALQPGVDVSLVIRGGAFLGSGGRPGDGARLTDPAPFPRAAEG